MISNASDSQDSCALGIFIGPVIEPQANNREYKPRIQVNTDYDDDELYMYIIHNLYQASLDEHGYSLRCLVR